MKYVVCCSSGSLTKPPQWNKAWCIVGGRFKTCWDLVILSSLNKVFSSVNKTKEVLEAHGYLILIQTLFSPLFILLIIYSPHQKCAIVIRLARPFNWAPVCRGKISREKRKEISNNFNSQTLAKTFVVFQGADKSHWSHLKQKIWPRKFSLFYCFQKMRTS